jgi:XTP/dITP diphosphohydrolase
VKLVLATRNRGKLVELERLLAGTGWQALMLTDFPEVPEVEEDGRTFAENAVKKARVAAQVTKTWTLAEDAGLEVDALGGEPGIRSARYCGEGASDRDRISRVLEQIIAVPDDKRTARFRCVMCLINPAGDERLFEGVCEGRIAPLARGRFGFGYDPVFVPDGYAQTFGELGLEVKSRISHRAQAMRQVVDYLAGQPVDARLPSHS